MKDHQRLPRGTGAGSEEDRRFAASAGMYAGVGLQFAIAIVLFLFLGRGLDARMGTNGIFTIAGVFVGAGAGFYSMYRKLMAAQAREEAERKARSEGGR